VKLLVVVGARPNFVKTAPVINALPATGIDVAVLHTGQHYDYQMSGAFLDQLGFPKPKHVLGIGSGSHAEQTAAVLTGVELVLLGERFDAILVPGDVNSTLAAALAAAKLAVPVIHLEAGLRSGDWSMPEEINRVLTDRLSELRLCHSPEALDHLASEGITTGATVLVGNTMIDSLFDLLPAADARDCCGRLDLPQKGFVLVTLHRPALVDCPAALGEVLGTLQTISEELPVVFPVHPRTRARMGGALPAAIRVIEPLDYLDFMGLQAQARLVITDSGGVQEETSALGVPCITYRTSTERPITITHGTNRLVGLDPALLLAAAREELGRPPADSITPVPLWDGRAGIRAAAAIAVHFGAGLREPMSSPTSPIADTAESRYLSSTSEEQER